MAEDDRRVDTGEELAAKREGIVNELYHPKGPYIKDVRTEGIGPKADIVREVAWIYSYRSSQNADKGGGGQKKTQKFCGRPLCMVPYRSFLTDN